MLTSQFLTACESVLWSLVPIEISPSELCFLRERVSEHKCIKSKSIVQ